MTHTDMDVTNVKFVEDDTEVVDHHAEQLWRDEHGDEDKYLDAYWESRYDFDEPRGRCEDAPCCGCCTNVYADHTEHFEYEY